MDFVVLVLKIQGSRSQTHGKFKMRCWRRLEDISWTDHVRNAEVLHRVERDINIVQKMEKKINCIGKIQHGNCLLKRIIEGNIEGRIKVKERQGRKRKQLLDDLTRNRRYCELKQEVLVRSLWRTGFWGAKDLFKTDLSMNE